MLSNQPRPADPDHTFVVPTYWKSPHLETCLASLKAQTSGSRIVVSTSTPFSGIEDLAATYGAETYVHSPNRGIGHDWNMAVGQSRSTWTTIAHQDDIYNPEYARRITAAGNGSQEPLIVFSNYSELRDSMKAAPAGLLAVKRLLLEVGFMGRITISRASDKRRALCLGCPIPCPAVTFHREALRGFRFREDLRVSLDWAAWLELAARRGAFVWVREVLMEHRIHDDSETMAGLRDGARSEEDLAILSSLWPQSVARLIRRSHGTAYQSKP